MHFELDAEQRAVVETTRAFVRRELVPHEDTVERDARLDPHLLQQLKDRAISAGLYAANMPEEVGGGGLDTLTWMLMERELGFTGYALQMLAVARPSRILLACSGSQRDEYLLPTVAGQRSECLAMTEPEAGSDLRGMRTRAVADPGGDWVLTGTKHFISHADHADYAIVFAATGEERSDGAPRRARITAFLVDTDAPGLTVHPGYRSVSHRGYDNFILTFDGCRVPAAAVLGEVGTGFEVANTWLGTRLQVAATCLGRAGRALDLAISYAATRRQFGQTIGRFQGVSFPLAEMATELESAAWLTWRAAALVDSGKDADTAIAMAKLKATEMLAMVADTAIQLHGGMGLMDELPLERIWRDARVERIWDGTSQIQRHIISRALLRAHGG
jgi:butyryl-CoA dehydrogenase